jgi:hypothetical protein
MSARDGVVYWVNPSLGTVVSCPATGCSGSPFEIARDLDRPHSIATDAYAVYFATATEILKCGLSGCADGPIPVVTRASPGDIAVSPSGVLVYWTDSEARAIKMCGTAGCGGSHNTVACGFNANQITTTATSVYWTTDDGRVSHL